MPTTRPSSDQGGEYNSIGVAPGSVEGVVGSYGRGSAPGRVASGDRITGNNEIANNKAGKQKMELNALMTIVPDSLNSVTNDGWEEIEMTVDSGASETVVGEDMISAVATKEGQASRRGVVYEVANGVRIPNLGEKQFVGVSHEGISRHITAQVCEVNKGLLSVRRMVAAGNRVVFDGQGSYIEDPQTGEIMNMEERNDMYILRLWTRGPKSSF